MGIIGLPPYGNLPTPEDEEKEEEAKEDGPSRPWSAVYRDALLDHLSIEKVPDPIPLITGMLYTNSIAWLAGKSGHGKSFVALDMCGCIGTGQPWQDRGTSQGVVLYVVAEGATGMKKRKRAWEESYGRDMTGVYWLPMAPQSADKAQWIGLTDVARELKPALIVLDTQARLTVGMEENSSKDMGVFVEQAERLRQATGACVLIVHHQGRVGTNMRGSTAMEGASVSTIQVVRDGTLVTLSNEKQKEEEEFVQFTLKLTPMGKSMILTLQGEGVRSSIDSAIPTATKWWETFRADKVSAAMLEKAEVATKPTLHRHITVLVEAGYADKIPTNVTETRFVYSLTGDPSNLSHAR